MTAVFQHVVRTWMGFNHAAPARLLSDTWPGVPPIPEGGLEASPREPREVSAPKSIEPRTHAQAWLSSLAAFDELRAHSDFATLLRRGVELLREAIGLERAAIFLLQHDRHLVGTFGTGGRGETTDERHIAFELGHSHREAFTLCNQGLAHWSRFPRVPLFAQSGDQTVVVRTGENVIVPIPTNNGCVGLIACDWGLSGANADTEALVRAAVFARVLGPLLVPWLSSLPPANLDPTAHTAAEQLVGAAIRRLRVAPNEDRHAIAKALGTTADRLGRVFKSEMGETLQDYRNRLRLERFFAVVEPEGGNLLRAALDAGFGSYAQFHRVFHTAFDCAPIEYLRRRGR